jgi:glycosyltransferase involved in cell wall biosynthesis
MVAAFESAGATVTCAAVKPLAVRQPLAALRSLRILRKVARARRVDVIFTSQLGYVSLLGLSRRIYGLPSVVHLGLALSFTSPLFRWSMAHIEATVAPSQPMRASCEALGWPSSRMKVVPNGVDLERFRPVTDKGALRAELGLPLGMPIVLYVGRLVAEKGIFTLVRAAGILRRRGVPFHLALVGEAPAQEGASLQSQATQLGLDAAFFSLRGPTPTPELFFAAADVAVVPSEWPEPFGLTAIEAMACGTVPVVSDAGILPEIIGRKNAAWVFPQGDTGQLAERISLLLSDPGLRQAGGLACLQRVQQEFSLVDCARSYERILLSCVNAR